MSRESNALKALVADRAEGSDVVPSDFRSVTGRVLTLGDVHGAGAISDVLTSLKEDDRLVLVGDLMDRGPQTIDFMQCLIKDNGRQIVAVRGNHEEMFLQYVRARAASAASEKPHSSDRAFIKEIFEEKLNPGGTYKKLTKAVVGQDNAVVGQDEATFLCNGGFWAESVELEDLQKMAKYVDALPYIRQVLLKDNQQFLVCHADMSMLDDEDVAALLRGEKNLTVEEKAALTWARKAGDEVSYASYNQARNSTSQRVYVGHEITTREGVEVVRRDTNHVNLDFGAYAGLPLVGIEHPNKVVVIGEFDEKVPGESKERYFSQLVKLHATIGDIEFSSKTVSNMYLDYVQKKKFRVLESNLLAVAPVPETDLDRRSRKLDADAFEKNLSKGGLSQEQLYQVMQSMRMGLSSDATLYQTDGRDGKTTRVLFSRHEKAVPSRPDILPRCVINIAGTLSELNRVDPAQHHVDASDLMRVLSDIAKMDKPVDCIQIPLAAGEDRKHFLHLQIFKKEDGIGARIIDSTMNHPLATVPTDFVQWVLSVNARSLQSILRADSATMHPLTVVCTGEQMRPTDKKCPFYVAKGMEAATKAILSTEPHLLAQDVWASNTVRHAHHVVSKTEEMALVFQLAKVSDGVPTETDAALYMADDLSFPVTPVKQEVVSAFVGHPLTESLLQAADKAEKGSENSASSLSKEDEAAYAAARIPSAALNPHRDVERILQLIENAASNKLADVVVAALKQYLQDRGGLKTSFFRQFSSVGKDYANDALARINRDPSEASAVIREILHMGLQKDGQLEVKHNSRLDHLLKAFAHNGLINPLSSVVGTMGIKINVNDVTVRSEDQEKTASRDSSLYSF